MDGRNSTSTTPGASSYKRKICIFLLISYYPISYYIIWLLKVWSEIYLAFDWYMSTQDKGFKDYEIGLGSSFLFIAKKVRKNIHRFSALELPLFQDINHCLTLLHFCSGKLISTRKLNYREKENHKKTSRIYKCHFQ